MHRLVALAGLLLAAPAAAVDIEWVPIGDAGNPAHANGYCYGPDCGAVAYDYSIAKYETTNAQYAEFLNAKAASDPLELYSTQMAIARSGAPGSYVYTPTPGFESKPVTLVSFYDAMRFANWLNNGQGTADTETGAYTLLGGTPEPSNGATVTRNALATVFVPSQHEWYKAAYYDPQVAGYFYWPSGTDTEFACSTPTATPHRGNCWSLVGGPADVGSYPGSPSPYGTFDQGGNVAEWNELLVNGSRGWRGGSWSSVASGECSMQIHSHQLPWVQTSDRGFRVASRVPEACSDGVDNDGDGLADVSDAGCASPTDLDEQSPLLACDDGVDNDGDETADFRLAGGDPSCGEILTIREDAACQDGLDNDGDGRIDFDGGASLDLDEDGFVDAQFNAATPAVGVPDPQCGAPWKRKERPGCGLGFELVLLAPLLSRLRRKRYSWIISAR